MITLRINNNNESLLETGNGATWALTVTAVAAATSERELGVECQMCVPWTRTKPQHVLTIWKKKILAQRQQITDHTGCLLPKWSIKNSTGFQERKHTCGLGFVLSEDTETSSIWFKSLHWQENYKTLAACGGSGPAELCSCPWCSGSSKSWSVTEPTTPSKYTRWATVIIAHSHFLVLWVPEDQSWLSASGWYFQDRLLD